MILCILVCTTILLPCQAQELSSQSIVTKRQTPGYFQLAYKQTATPLYINTTDFPVVQIAAKALASDIEQVTGNMPEIVNSPPLMTDHVVLIGTLGKNPFIDKLADSKKLNVESIRGAWESFVIATVSDPMPGVRKGLVIAGSDRRGTAYGVFTLSEAMGVSPWIWWADVTSRRHKSLFVRPGDYRQGPPSVKYRGIFINDEDWGLQEWAEKNFENGPSEVRDIGPKTYAKVFELLLRLKANYLWPAMHPSTKPFNFYQENKIVADRYAIVMGSSHAEPMLRNNVGEWPHDQVKMWNPITNLPGILNYWEQRVRENGHYENIYTVGMRGIHDSGMPGGGTISEKRNRLEKIIELQREMLAKYVSPDTSLVPQIFCPYKETLELYQAGMNLPDDITIVWPDDNFGYIRQLPNVSERKRSGGHGVYYHISYWGRPHDYLWLESTSPSLIWHEMTKAYESGAQQLWILNVGDIKPLEAGMTMFLRLAWNIKSYGPKVQQEFLRDFYAEQFGKGHADAIGKLKDEYFRLCAIRRPEHMGFNSVYPNTPAQNSYWSHAPENDEALKILQRWIKHAQRAEMYANKIPAELRDAYFQLIEYPSLAGAAMAEKMIMAEKARLTGLNDLVQRTEAAQKRIEELTETYNAQNDGKWRWIMDHQPRRLPVFDLPPLSNKATATAIPSTSQNVGQIFEINPSKFAKSHDRNGVGWRIIDGIGPRGSAISVLPQRGSPRLRTPKEIREQAPVAEYIVRTANAREVEVVIEALPTHRLTPAHEVIVAVSVNDGEPVVVSFEQGGDDEDDPIWQRNILRNAMDGKVKLHLPKGISKLKLWAADPSIVIQWITLGDLGTRI